MTQTHTPPKRFSRSRTAIQARTRLRQLLLTGMDDDGLWRTVQTEVPEAWATLAEDMPFTEERDKISLRLDKSVIKAFRATGPGYQARINQVLATYVQLKISEIERETASVNALIREHGYPFDEDIVELIETLGIFEDLE